MTTKRIALARRFRKAPTEPEQLLWQRLRRHGDGPQFRRQHPVGPYVLDIYCARAKLAVEVDGSLHGEACQTARDEARDAWLRNKGITAYRLPAGEIYRNADAAADGVKLLADDLIRRRKALR